jgi:hypothetical protein
MIHRKTTLPKYSRSYPLPGSGPTSTTARIRSRRRFETVNSHSTTSSLSSGRRSWTARRSMLGIVMMSGKRRPVPPPFPLISWLRSSPRSKDQGACRIRSTSEAKLVDCRLLYTHTLTSCPHSMQAFALEGFDKITIRDVDYTVKIQIPASSFGRPSVARRGAWRSRDQLQRYPPPRPREHYRSCRGCRREDRRPWQKESEDSAE